MKTFPNLRIKREKMRAAKLNKKKALRISRPLGTPLA
jgi:hypothetical protein